MSTLTNQELIDQNKEIINQNLKLIVGSQRYKFINEHLAQVSELPEHDDEIFDVENDCKVEQNPIINNNEQFANPNPNRRSALSCDSDDSSFKRRDILGRPVVTNLSMSSETSIKTLPFENFMDNENYRINPHEQTDTASEEDYIPFELNAADVQTIQRAQDFMNETVFSRQKRVRRTKNYIIVTSSIMFLLIIAIALTKIDYYNIIRDSMLSGDCKISSYYSDTVTDLYYVHLKYQNYSTGYFTYDKQMIDYLECPDDNTNTCEIECYFLNTDIDGTLSIKELNFNHIMMIPIILIAVFSVALAILTIWCLKTTYYYRELKKRRDC